MIVIQSYIESINSLKNLIKRQNFKFPLEASNQVKASQKYFIQVNPQSYHRTLEKLKHLGFFIPT